MRLSPWPLAALLAWSGCFAHAESSLRWQPVAAELTLPLPHTPAEKKALFRQLAPALDELPTRAGAAPRGRNVRGGLYALHGDLFGTGDCFALISFPQKELSPPPNRVAFVEWKDGSWQVRGLWEIDPLWRRQGWTSTEHDELPITPAAVPFQLRDYSGDGVPEVLVACDVERYYQDYALLRFDAKARQLHLLAESQNPPKMAGSFVRVYRSSGRHLDYEEWTFLHWSHGRLHRALTWHESTAFDHFTLCALEQPDGTTVEYELTQVRAMPEGRTAFDITRASQPYVHVELTWRDPEVSSVTLDAREAIFPWLFERITGLPHPYRQAKDPSYIVELPKIATIQVTGDKEGVQKLTANPRRTVRGARK